MTYYVKKNNASSTVADNPLAAGATTLNVASGEGSNFPSTFPFPITVWNKTTYPNPGSDSGMEICICTGRTTDALTITRGAEGTSDVAHTSGEQVAILVTAGMFDDSTYGIEGAIDTHIADTTTHGTTGNVVGHTDIQTLTNKSIDSDNNTITNIVNTDVKAAAAIAESKLAMDDTTGHTHTGAAGNGSKLTAASVDVVDAGGKITATDVEGALVENRTALDTEEAALVTHMSDTSTHGITSDIVGRTETQTLINKSIDSVNNTITNIVNADIKSDAAIVYGKLQDISATNRLLGRSSALAGDIEEITVGGDLTQSGSNLTINADAVTYDKIQDTTGTDKILGRSSALGGTVEEITCTAAGRAILDDADASTQRTTLNVDAAGTDNSTDVTLNASATTGGLSLAAQEISHRAASNVQTGYATAAQITAIEANTGKTTNATHTGDVTGSGELTIGADKVHDSMIDWGTGASQVSAVDLPIADAGAVITATEVEGALQENRTALDVEEAALVTHMADTTTHGTTGDIVGISDTQTLSNKSISDTLNVDNIAEKTTSAGVTIDGDIKIREYLIDHVSGTTDSDFICINHEGNGSAYFRNFYVRDGKNANVIIVTGSSKETDFYGAIKTNTISEHTAATGVTIDGVLCKDDDVVLKNNVGIVKITEVGGTERNALYMSNSDKMIMGVNTNVSRFTGSNVEIYTSSGYIANFAAAALQIDTISEKTGAAGVLVDGVKCKDSTIITATSTPASAGAAGVTGQWAWDASYIYICINTNTWQRVAHATW